MKEFRGVNPKEVRFDGLNGKYPLSVRLGEVGIDMGLIKVELGL